jgi:hypothetical protein
MADDFDPKDFSREAEQEQQAKGNGTAKPAHRKLALVWADDIEPNIAEPGLVDGLLGTVGITVAYGESTGEQVSTTPHCARGTSS